MLTFEDCLAYCDLTAEEIAAIAEHEHVPEMIAAELGHYLVVTPDGRRYIRRIILGDIAVARNRGDTLRAALLMRVLQHFCRKHPDCMQRIAKKP